VCVCVSVSVSVSVSVHTFFVLITPLPSPLPHRPQSRSGAQDHYYQSLPDRNAKSGAESCYACRHVSGVRAANQRHDPSSYRQKHRDRTTEKRANRTARRACLACSPAAVAAHRDGSAVCSRRNSACGQVSCCATWIRVCMDMLYFPVYSSLLCVVSSWRLCGIRR